MYMTRQPLSAPNAEVEFDLLRAVLELTVVVAQAGQRVSPPVPAPAPLRPYLRFTHKVPTPALRVARRVLDNDEEWRARVALVVTDELVGRAGVIFAQRPPGWEQELDTLRSDARGLLESSVSEATGRDAQRRLSAAEESTRRSEAAARAVEEALVKLRVDHAAIQVRLSVEMAGRQVADAKVASLTAALELAQEALRGAAVAHDALVAEHQILLDTHHQLLGVAGEVHTLDTQRAQLLRSTTAALGGVDALRASLIRMRAEIAEGETPIEASGAATSSPALPTPSRAERAALREAGQSKGQRMPLVLPRAVFDDSVEAARFLIRVPGVLVLVDGYNLAKWKWPTVAPRDLRARLGGVLADVSSRTDADVCVVYDGVDEGGAIRPVGATRVRVRVLFSSGEVEADDVIIDMVASTPNWRAVVVVSSDRRVRDGVARLGASVLSSQQFGAAWC